MVFNAGETIFKSGGPLTHIVCITKGMVKVYLEDVTSNKNVIIGIIKAGEILGGPGFLVDNTHHFTVVALEETTTCFIRNEDFKKVMESNVQFTMQFVKYLNERIIKQYEKILNLSHKQTHGKIADTLLYFSNVIYMNSSFETRLSRQDIADLSTITKESAIRVMKDLADEGIIKCHQNQIEILNKDMLMKISNKG